MKISVEYCKVFQSMFRLQNQGKEKVKKFVDNNNLTQPLQPSIQENNKNLLSVLTEKGKGN